MAQLVRYQVRQRVAIVTVDNPPVNALSPGVPEGISDAIARASADDAADAIVLIGDGTTFIAGADINVFKTLKTRAQSLERSESVHTRLKQIEDASKPLVAAIHGHALGGGRDHPIRQAPYERIRLWAGWRQCAPWAGAQSVEYRPYDRGF